MNNNDNKINLFEGLPIRKEWDNENEKWWFSVVDVVGILTEQATSKSASTYWAVLKKRLIKVVSQKVEISQRLPMRGRITWILN